MSRYIDSIARHVKLIVYRYIQVLNIQASKVSTRVLMCFRPSYIVPIGGVNGAVRFFIEAFKREGVFIEHSEEACR